MFEPAVFCSTLRFCSLFECKSRYFETESSSFDINVNLNVIMILPALGENDDVSTGQTEEYARPRWESNQRPIGHA